MCKHHCVFSRAGKISVDLCMPGIMMARQIYMLFVEGVGHGGVYFAGKGQFNHLFYILKCAFAAHFFTFKVSLFKFLRTHGLCQGFPVLSVQALIEIDDPHIVYIDRPVFKQSILHIRDPVDGQLFSAADQREGIFHADSVTDDHRAAFFISRGIHQGFYRDLRAVPGRIPHRDTKYGTRVSDVYSHYFLLS